MSTEELPTEEQTIPKPSEAAKPANGDLSAEIAQAVSKQPGDRVRVARVWGDHYRCNWVSPASTKLEGALLASFRIRQSRFLKVIRDQGGQLVIVDKTATR
jgi:hypothetical protein